MNKIVFLDRDGTLNPDPGYISSIDLYKFYPDTLTSLSALAEEGYKFVVVTNQSGIARGLIQEDVLEEIHDYITEEFLQAGIPLLGIYHCPHYPDDGCSCRKPATGLFDDAAHQHNIDLTSALMIGDSAADIEAGKSIGMLTCLVRTGKGNDEETKLRLSGLQPDYVGDTLTDCTAYLIEQLEKSTGEDDL